MSYFPFGFEGAVTLHGVGKARVVTYKVLFLPEELLPVLPFDTYPRLRVEGEVADIPVRGAWMPVGGGRRYFIVSPTVLTQAGVTVGDRVEMRFRIDNQDFVELPKGLTEALRLRPDARALWDDLTPGKQRMLAAHVASAKTQATEQRRIDEALEALAAGITLRELQTRRKAARSKERP